MSQRMRPRSGSVSKRSFAVLSCGLLAIGSMLTSPVQAWDANGHRAITWLALDGLKPVSADKPLPLFFQDQSVRHAIAWQSAEPDRWRGVASPILRHENAMDHYIDVEDLAFFGLTLETVSPLRYRFVRDMAIARSKNPAGPDGNSEPYNERRDPAGDKEFPGFALHEIVEHQAKLISQFKTWRVLDKLNDPIREPQKVMTQANIMATMGIMSHFVGDIAQPLHTTKHFNGWVGENPQGYTTAKSFHSYIDGGVLDLHGLNYNTLKPTQKFTATVDGMSPWQPTVAYLRRSFALVEPLYKLEKSGALNQEEGKAFITRQLNDAAEMLAAYYQSAWDVSEPTQKDIDDFVRYDGFAIEQLPKPAASSTAATEKAEVPDAAIIAPASEPSRPK